MRYLPLVNIQQGSRSYERFSTGNTLPFTQLPFAMAGFVPQTGIVGNPRWFYHPDHRALEGVRLSHQPSPWIGEYGALLFMPQSGDRPQSQPNNYWSSYRPQEATLAPDYMRLHFIRYQVDMETAPTERGGIFRLNYREEDRPAFFSVLPVKGECGYRLDTDNDRLYAWTNGHYDDEAHRFCTYYVLQFEKGVIDSGHTQVTRKHAASPGTAIQGADCGIHVALRTHRLQVQVAISYISWEQALRNLQQEQADFDTVRERATQLWEKRLSSIEVETENEERLRTFYSCLYRCMLFPHKCYELGANGEPVHYSPHDGRTRPGVRYADNGFWDTSRTLFPLLSLIAPEDYREMLEGFVQDYRDGGWLPRWPSLGEVGCMPSTHIDSIIADAAVKGLASRELLETALEGMLKHANVEPPEKRFGRSGVSAGVKYGYIPFDVEKKSVNRTLDDAYGNFCIAQVAQVLGKSECEQIYRERATHYKNLFDPETGFMRSRDSQGRHRSAPFRATDWGDDYCEGSAWQTSFYVPHDIDGLAALHGGREALAAKLDELFATPPTYNADGYGRTTHEMAELAAVDFGQCAISNQPSFHVPFLFAALDQPEKTNYWVEKICRELFSSQDDGFPGDEDTGSMSAWYILASLGLYPLCPGKPEYIKSQMLVRSAKLCGQTWDNTDFGSYIPYEGIMRLLHAD